MKNNIDRTKYLMGYDVKKTLLENFDVLMPKDNTYVFDFVVTEDAKYMIFADNLISKQHGYIGSIWENTWVINEIIKENYNFNKGLIQESVVDSINWTKELVVEIMSNQPLNEYSWRDVKRGWNNAVDSVVDTVSDAGEWVADKTSDAVDYVGDKLSDAGEWIADKASDAWEWGKEQLIKVAGLVFNGFLDMLRWVRRNAYTTIGIVIDVITALIPYTTLGNKIAWALIVLLDIYEIVTGEQDPKDYDRNKNPYMYLFFDIIALVLTSAAASTAKVAVKSFLGSGKLLSGVVKGTIETVAKALPGLVKTLQSVGKTIIKHIPGSKYIVDLAVNGFSKLLGGLDTFISQLLSKKGVVAVASGAAVGYAVAPDVWSIGDKNAVFKEYKKYFQMDPELGDSGHNIINPNCLVDTKSIDNTDVYDQATSNATKIFARCINSMPNAGKKLRTDGKIDGDILMAAGVEPPEGAISKHTPEFIKKGLAKGVGKGSEFLQNTLSPIAAKGTTNV